MSTRFIIRALIRSEIEVVTKRKCLKVKQLNYYFFHYVHSVVKNYSPSPLKLSEKTCFLWRDRPVVLDSLTVTIIDDCVISPLSPSTSSDLEENAILSEYL